MLFAAAALSALALGASAAPFNKRAVTDTDVLQYALTLEHLENKFYSDALAKFDESAFEAAGFPSWVRGRFLQISEHEASHVAVLSGALGDAAVQPCNYTFPYTDVTSFVGLSKVIENVGVSAYLGAAGFITEKAYLGVAATILTTEARHQSWVSSSVNHQEPWSGPYDTPLGLNQVYSIAGGFITGCPSSNAVLPVSAFPAASLAAGTEPGQTGQLTFTTTGQSESLAIYSGLSVVLAPIAVDGTVTLPGNLQGISYGVITTAANSTSVTDANTVAGPIILDFTFPASARNPMFA